MSRMLTLWHVALLALGAVWQWYVVAPIQGGPIFSPAPFDWGLLLVPAAVLGTIGGILEGWATGFGRRLLAGIVAFVAWLPMLGAMRLFGHWFADERYLGGEPPALSWYNFVTPVCCLLLFLALLWAVAAFTASRVAEWSSSSAPNR